MGYASQMLCAAKAARQLRSYVPKRVGFREILRWYKQYPPNARDSLAKLLAAIEFFDERSVVSALVDGNKAIVELLREDGLDSQNIIYVQHDKPGSSSSLMLNLLRDAAQLELRKSIMLDGRDKDEISAHTKRLGLGAIVYVDDFAGTGNQFLRNRSHIAQYISGSFSEFFLSVVVCEEALLEMQAVRVAAKAHRIHWKSERPLNESCEMLSPDDRQMLQDIADSYFEGGGLGYNDLATSVVFYRNAPDSTPRLIRGGAGQTPYFGILPRTTDLAIV